MKKLPLFLLLSAVVLASCKDRYVTENVENLFRPSASSAPVVSANTVSYSWYGIDGAVGYRFQMSRVADFSEICFEKDLLIPKIKVEGLKYNTSYYSRVKALAYKPEFDSKWNSLERVTTAARVVPVVLYEVRDEDIGATSVVLRWDTSRYVTRIVVSGMGSSTFSSTVLLQDPDRLKGNVTVDGLKASSSYQAVIYDDTITLEEERSFNIITFRTPKMIPDDKRADGRLLGISEDLMEAIESAEDGQTLILPRGYRYTTSTSKPVTIQKDLCILSARQGDYPLEQGADDVRPVIVVQTVSKAAQIVQMPFHVSGTHRQLRFEGIDFQSAAAGKNCVPFYFDGALSLEWFIVENCSFRNCSSGVLMFDSSASQTVDNVLFRDDIIDNCATNTGYRTFTLCNPNLSIADFDLERCVLCYSKFGLFADTSQYSVSGGVFQGHMNISLRNCDTASLFCSRSGGTGSTKMFDMPSSENMVVKLERCLFTRNGNAGGTNFHSLGASSSFEAVSCLYTTGDFSINQSGGAIATGIFPLEGKFSEDVFKDYENDDFTIVDTDVTGAAVGCSRDWSWLPVME